MTISLTAPWACHLYNHLFFSGKSNIIMCSFSEQLWAKTVNYSSLWYTPLKNARLRRPRKINNACCSIHDCPPPMLPLLLLLQVVWVILIFSTFCLVPVDLGRQPRHVWLYNTWLPKWESFIPIRLLCCNYIFIYRFYFQYRKWGRKGFTI